MHRGMRNGFWSAQSVYHTSIRDRKSHSRSVGALSDRLPRACRTTERAGAQELPNGILAAPAEERGLENVRDADSFTQGMFVSGKTGVESADAF